LACFQGSDAKPDVSEAEAARCDSSGRDGRSKIRHNGCLSYFTSKAMTAGLYEPAQEFRLKLLPRPRQRNHLHSAITSAV
jgi:hypothetical protein